MFSASLELKYLLRSPDDCSCLFLLYSQNLQENKQNITYKKNTMENSRHIITVEVEIQHQDNTERSPAKITPAMQPMTKLIFCTD